MQGPDRLVELCRGGRMRWTGEGWLAEPDEVVDALTREGFQECKREVARNPADHAQAGGVWQGLNTQTGAVVRQSRSATAPPGRDERGGV